MPETLREGGAPARLGPCRNHVETAWLFRGASVGLHSWSCAKTNHAPGEEEGQTHHEIAFVLGGLFECVGPRGRAVADANTAVFLNAGEPYRSAHPLGAGDAGLSLVVAPETIAELQARDRPRDLDDGRIRFRSLAATLSPRTLLRLSLLRRRLRSGEPRDDGELEEALHHLLESAWRDARPAAAAERRRTARAAESRERVEEVRRILAAEFDRPLRLGDLARRAGLSTSHLCRRFREDTGLSLHRYLNRLRLRAALAALDSPRRDLSDLAFAVGFSSHSHFTFAFRREFGITPSRFRGLSRADLLRLDSTAPPR